MPIETCRCCESPMEESDTTFTVVKDEAVYIVKNVPCLKCTLCEEAIFTDDTADKLARYASGRVSPMRPRMTAYVYKWADPLMEILPHSPQAEGKYVLSVEPASTGLPARQLTR